MKRVIESHFLCEAEIHGSSSFLQRINTLQEYYEDFVLKNLTSFFVRSCPACLSPDFDHAFKIRRSEYQICRNCCSVFISPCPEEESIYHFFEKEDVKHIFNDPQLIDDEEKRLSSVWDWRLNLLETLLPHEKNAQIAEIGAKYGRFTEKLRRRFPNAAVDSFSGFYGIGKFDGRLSFPPREITRNSCDLVTLFDCVESFVVIPDKLHVIHDMLKKGGRLVLTTRSGSGFDINALWDRAAIFPSEHRSLISVKGMHELLNNLKLIINEISTPGQLDTDIVKKRIHEVGNEQRFIKSLYSRNNQNLLSNFQNFLQENLLSSHMFVVCSKP